MKRTKFNRIKFKRTRFKRFPNRSGVYCIKSTVNNKQYVGSAVNLYGRKYSHLSSLNLDSHDNQHLQNHVNKHGINILKFFVLEFCLKEKLIEREQYYLDILHPEFNIYTNAYSPFGSKHSEESKRKMSEIKKGKKNSFFGKKHTEESKRKNREAHIGKKHSEEARRKIGESGKGKHTGEANPMFGKPAWSKGLTKETDSRVKRISEVLKGHIAWNKGLTKETDPRIKSLAWNKGLTKETDSRVKRGSESHKGRIPWNKDLTKETDERVKQISESLLKHNVRRRA